MKRPLRSFLLVGGIAAIGLMSGAKLTQVAIAKGADPYQEIDTLAQALHHIEAQYIEPVETGSLILGAIEGMTDQLDAHSVFLDPDELEAAQVRTEGVYSGIGVEIKKIDDAVTVSRVVPNSPADGRIVRGDLLTAIDGQAMTDLSVIGAALRGREGQPVTLTIQRAGEKQEVKLTRSRIRDQTVRVDSIGDGWVLAEISRFQRNTVADLERGLRQLKPSVGVILDLRGNRGGLLEEAVGVVNLFAESGLIVRTRGRDQAILEEHYAAKPTPWAQLQTIVLIDGQSASASEIVAGSLRALHAAQLVGTPSYGKWSVQRLYVFESKSAIKLTIAKYEIADDEVGVDQEGLKPDLVVARPSPEGAAAAALRKRLAGDDKALTLLETLTNGLDNTTPPPILLPLTERLNSDPQLKAAWTLARANR